jgi:OHCU decarboxylase
MTTLADLNKASTDQFVAVLGGIFEHSPWVAQRVAPKRPFANVQALHAAMVQAIEDEGLEAQLKLIRAHPELAGKAAVRGELTEESTREQSGAGLNLCSAEEFAKLHALNDAYNAKFGFPFIVGCVAMIGTASSPCLSSAWATRWTRSARNACARFIRSVLFAWLTWWPFDLRRAGPAEASLFCAACVC